MNIHKAFQISVALKGVHALIECVGGLILAFVSTKELRDVVNFITQEELRRNPHDAVAQYFLGMAQQFTVGTKEFYAIYLLCHGAIKVGLVIALLKNKPWAYPLSLAVLGAFVAYQLYRYALTQSIGLLLLSLGDVVVIAFIWREYRNVRAHKQAAH